MVSILQTMSGHGLKVIPDDALFGGESEKATIPPQIQDLEQMAPEASAAVAISTPRVSVAKKGLPKWGPAFLAILPEVNGNLVSAAEAVGRSLSIVCRARNEYPDLAKGINGIKTVVDTDRLERLEARSARLADDDKNTVERIFQLNALRPDRYRPRAGGNQLTSINITMGVSVPKPPDFSQAQEIPASVTMEDSP